MSRPLEAVIRLDHLRHNYHVGRALAGGKALAVVKANAYGHGAVQCAAALFDADGFAVACIEEAIELREAGVTQPILLLEGVFEASELELAERQDLWLVVHHEGQIDMIEAAEPKTPYKVWLKMDSGMHRAGFAPSEYRAAHRRLQACGKVESITMMSHFARADEPGNQATADQIAVFQNAVEGLKGDISLANSAGLIGWPAARAGWGRAGIMLYGASPMPADSPAIDLKPVMQLKSKVFAVRELAEGEPVGYGASFHTPRATRVGVVACGYADGYPRLASTGSPVAINGQRTRIIGRVSMDMLMIDLTDLPEAGVGSEVELWGDTVSVNEVAAHAGTIAYELLCNVKRAAFRYR
ncbi:alanine racemase [Crenobacter cavernae]|uniref:Alanine racemase n=1 Tax=Crenobacter cavernae TaxID=2290923 RepID=A0A345Y9X9_9NEIS|nr:alanine racemase [Crenobacter cavernae]AXK40731.1 alanine racemase [Crenobacter cavernae]